jgi:NOT2 / NOT3 / NOT5 family
VQEFKLWLTRIPNTEPIMKTERFERGSYLVFDTNTWDAVRKDNFVVRSSDQISTHHPGLVQGLLQESELVWMSVRLHQMVLWLS